MNNNPLVQMGGPKRVTAVLHLRLSCSSNTATPLVPIFTATNDAVGEVNLSLAQAECQHGRRGWCGWLFLVDKGKVSVCVSPLECGPALSRPWSTMHCNAHTFSSNDVLSSLRRSPKCAKYFWQKWINCWLVTKLFTPVVIIIYHSLRTPILESWLLLNTALIGKMLSCVFI